MNISEKDAYSKAKKKVKEIKGFYYHLTCYCATMPIVIYINLKFVPGFHWFWFSLLGWGAAILIHGVVTFDRFPFLGKDWEERKVQKMMEKKRNNNWE
ncbi:2TM domain-containing protein [Flavobacterium rhizosphaerae]|uniref:2TM domain-containing protein n=1 Tax=Flavobacterium rhizosphaerae TaxID=3163298 RepID=A0ABW8YW47_9FLAO